MAFRHYPGYLARSDTAPMVHFDPHAPDPASDSEKVASLIDFTAFLDTLATEWDVQQNRTFLVGRERRPESPPRWKPVYISDFLRAWSDTIRHQALYHPDQLDPNTDHLTWARIAGMLAFASSGSMTERTYKQ